MSRSPFDFIKEILKDKNQLIVDSITEKEYVPFIINRGISYYRDCILQANQMNQRHFLPKKMQNDFYLNSVRAYKRPYVKWGKSDKIEHLENVKRFFNVSSEKAKDILPLLTKEDVKEIIKSTDIGGMMRK